MDVGETQNNINEAVQRKICMDMPGGILWYKAGPTPRIIFANKTSLEIMGYGLLSEAELAGKDNLFEFVHPDYISYVKEKNLNMERTGMQTKLELSLVNKDGRIYCISGSATPSKNSEGNPYIQLAYTDITETVKSKNELKYRESIIKCAIEQSNMAIWTYNIKERRVEGEYWGENLFGDYFNAPNSPEVFYGSGSIHKEDESLVKAMYTDLFAGKTNVQSIARWMNKSTGNYFWCKIVYTTKFDEHGKPVKAIGTATDVGSSKYLNVRYKEEMGLMEIVTPKTLYNMRANLVTGEIEEIVGLGNKNNSLAKSGNVEEFLSKVLNSITTADDRERAAKILNLDYFFYRYEKGLSAFSVEYVRKFDDGNERFVHVEIRLRKNPITNALTAFLYGTDVSSEKINREIINRIMQMDYEFLGLINVETAKVGAYYYKGMLDIYTAVKQDDYGKAIRAILQKTVLEEYKETAFEQMSLVTIKAALEKQAVYRCILPAVDRNGKVVWKKWAFSYLSKEKTTIVYCRRDITDIVEGEQAKNRELADALMAAELASKAKTDFLSRMSHEIRTPMNVIIGMSTIAAKAAGKNEEVSECIAKIGISAHYLLSLINDILDMSKIESGRVFLHHEEINMTEVLKEINDICYAQAAQHNVNYECIVGHTLDDYYVGDAGKLQQVLINIISNAIKFTPEGGKVNFSVQQVRKTGKKVNIKFVVNDTGCGISEEFLEHIFEPFAQEETGTTSKYGGTGLGLAISNNITNMMGGKIIIRSIKNIGSEFTVTIPLDVSEKSLLRQKDDRVSSLVNLNTLVVDDDVNVCEEATALLTDMGINAEWVDSGQKAIAKVQEKIAQAHYYDIILVDWKMPDMDGIETTRAIRKIVGPEVTIIIITAYEWTNIEQAAKNAGANSLMDKPIFKSSLAAAFTKTFQSKEKENIVNNLETFDFSNKCLLLVEDHPINAEVAKKLLTCKGFAVDIANNGLRALELFTTKPPGYYDAILMDIRMPLMDGLQATQAIRRLDKADANTVPIIAMTANAFEEDVENTKRAGMDAHLAKPIEPKLMYKTLYHFIYNKKN